MFLTYKCHVNVRKKHMFLLYENVFVAEMLNLHDDSSDVTHEIGDDNDESLNLTPSLRPMVNCQGHRSAKRLAGEDESDSESDLDGGLLNRAEKNIVRKKSVFSDDSEIQSSDDSNVACKLSTDDSSDERRSSAMGESESSNSGSSSESSDDSSVTTSSHDSSSESSSATQVSPGGPRTPTPRMSRQARTQTRRKRTTPSRRNEGRGSL